MNTSLIHIAAWIALTGFAGMICFQVLLALGAPWGKAAWGGSHRKLPVSLRIGSLLAVGIYVFGGILILEKAGICTVFDKPLLAEIGIWVLAGIFGLSFIGNLLSKSKVEKAIMIPVSLVLCITCVLVAWKL